MVRGGLEWCGVLELTKVKNVCKIDTFSVNSGFFDTKMEILTPAPLVVLVTNIRYGRDCYILYDHISHEMHVVQQFNMATQIFGLNLLILKELVSLMNLEIMLNLGQKSDLPAG